MPLAADAARAPSRDGRPPRGERARTQGGVARAGGVEAPVAGEAPGAADEDAHADPFGLVVGDVRRRARSSSRPLGAPHDRARVCIGRTGAERGIDRRLGRGRAPARTLRRGAGDAAATIRAPRWWRNW